MVSVCCHGDDDSRYWRGKIATDNHTTTTVIKIQFDTLFPKSCASFIPGIMGWTGVWQVCWQMSPSLQPVLQGLWSHLLLNESHLLGFGVETEEHSAGRDQEETLCICVALLSSACRSGLQCPVTAHAVMCLV